MRILVPVNGVIKVTFMLIKPSFSFAISPCQLPSLMWGTWHVKHAVGSVTYIQCQDGSNWMNIYDVQVIIGSMGFVVFTWVQPCLFHITTHMPTSRKALDFFHLCRWAIPCACPRFVGKPQTARYRIAPSGSRRVFKASFLGDQITHDICSPHVK